MDKIITHVSVDLDAALSVAAARQFIPGAKEADVVFYPANWDEEGFEKILILDIPAGGRGIKGVEDSDGKVHSCFKSVVEGFASEEDREILAPLVEWVDLQDSTGMTVDSLIPFANYEVKEIFAFSSISAIFRALKQFHGWNDRVVCERMDEIFQGLLSVGRARRKAEIEADQVELLYGGRIAVVSDARYQATTGILFRKYGVRVVIYKNGDNLGLLKHSDERLQLDHDEIRQIVSEAGEEKQWYAHPGGWLYCRGSRKSPAQSPSQVDPHALAEVVARLLDERQISVGVSRDSIKKSLSEL